MRPSSSTSSVTDWPSKPRCAITTSTSSVVPLSAVRGVVTRPIWMSLVERLATDADREDRHALGLQPEQRVAERGVRRVGAVADHHEPGETATRPVPGAPLRARRPGGSRCRRTSGRRPRSPASTVDENRKTRTVKRSASALSVPASSAPNSDRTIRRARLARLRRRSASSASRPAARRRRSAAAPRPGRRAPAGRDTRGRAASSATRSCVSTMPIAQRQRAPPR